jgi:hypothetical protein
MRRTRIVPRAALAIAAFAALAAKHQLASASGDCDSLVGKTFFADEKLPPLAFAEQRLDGIYLNQHVSPGEKVRITGFSTSEYDEQDLIVVTEDGRELRMKCWLVLGAVNGSQPGQQLLQSDAKDLAEAKQILKEKQEAAAKEARRKRLVEADRKAERERQQERERREYIAQRMARGGVKIGMNEQQVLASSWGEPDKRNHTITPKGDSQQWVYGGGQYFLYFQSGILTGIQTDSPDDGYYRVAH